MAIAFAHVSIHTRAKGHSAIAASSYRSGTRLYDGRTGIMHDYSDRHAVPEQPRIVPHPRTLRNARENIKHMVLRVSPRYIKRYLLAWAAWWVRTAVCWTKQTLLAWFLQACWDKSARHMLSELFGLSKTITSLGLEPFDWAVGPGV